MLGYIGVYTARLEMPWVSNLKEKRALVRPVTERLKARFPVSVARLDGLDAHDWEIIGVVSISHDAVWLDGLLQNVADFVVANGEYTVCNETFEVLDLER
ncbi:MAG: DUF503 domain-containing protein [Deinococcales bacterium]